MKKMWKKTACIFLALMMIFSTGCGSAKRDTVSMPGLCEAMLAADSNFPEMTTYTSEDENAQEILGYVFDDLDYEMLDGFFLSYCTDGKLADEVAVFAVKDIKDIDAMQSMVEDHVRSRVLLYQNYLPEQTSRAEAAVVFTQDQYVVLIISDSASDVKAAFTDYVNQANSVSGTEE